jgi:predicted deacetylase
MAVPPGSRKTNGPIPASSSRAASRFTCVDFPQPSAPSNVINGMATILRQSATVVERPIFALFVRRVRRKFGLMTEFFDLDYEEAFARIVKARDEFKAARLSPLGFVAPAWLLSAEGERAAHDAGMQYTTRIDSVLDLLTGERRPSRSLVYSVQSGWRRTVSLAWNAALARTLEMRELARLSIHPGDFAEPKIRTQILQFIERFFRTRNATTYCDWIGSQRTNQKAV